MNTKGITSISYILVGNMLTTYSGIGEGWSAKIIVFFGLILFFVGLIQLKSILDERGASGVSKLMWAAILGIIANLLSFIPIVGVILSGILNLIAFIMQIVGLVNLKHSEKLGKTGAGGVNILLLALTFMILAGIFKIIPFVGGTIKTVISLIAFVIIPFGWIKIQEAIAENVLLTSSTISNSEVNPKTENKIVEKTSSIDFGELIYKNRVAIIGIIVLLAVIAGGYFLFLKPNPERDGRKSAAFQRIQTTVNASNKFIGNWGDDNYYCKIINDEKGIKYLETDLNGQVVDERYMSCYMVYENGKLSGMNNLYRQGSYFQYHFTLELIDNSTMIFHSSDAGVIDGRKFHKR